MDGDSANSLDWDIYEIQSCGSMKFWYGSGSADPYLWLMDPDPAIFVSDLQDVNNKLFSKFLCLLLFEGTYI